MGQTTIPAGDVSGTWTSKGSPYFIEGDITVPADSLLVIQPGVSVEFLGGFIFNVHGLIDCQGTESDSIHFYSGSFPAHRGMHIDTDTNVMDSIIFTYCRFEGGRGAGEWPENCGIGIGIQEFDRIRIEHCLFKDNRAWTGSQAAGGAIATGGFCGIIRNNSFIDNRSVYGGAIILWDGSHAMVCNNYFYNNRATYEGGAIIYFENTDGLCYGNTFIQNRANQKGGAISLYYKSHPQISHNLFYDNTAMQRGGGVYLEVECSPDLINNTFVENFATLGGGAIQNNEESCPRLINNILWNNTAETGSQFCNDDTTCIPKFFNNDIQYGKDSIAGFHDLCDWKNNIDAYPEFADTAAAIFNLSWISPCLDAGTDTIMDPDGTVSDLGAFWFDQTSIGIQNPENTDIDFIVYPNPVESVIRFRVQGAGCRELSIVDCRLSIFDVNGRLIDQIYPSEKEIRYDASHLSPGIYLIHLNIGNLSGSKKIIKK